MAGSLHHFRHSIGSGALQPVSERRLDSSMVPSADAAGVIPVGVLYNDIISANPGDEVLVAGMFGEVVIFGFANGALSNQPLQILRLDGCVGLHGAIRKDGSSIYIAGSQGVWRLDQQ